MSNKKHIIEVAKSSRSKCRTCKEKIEKGELRLGEEVENIFDPDGDTTYHYHHLSCAPRSKPVILKQALEDSSLSIPNKSELLEIIKKKQQTKEQSIVNKFPYAEKSPSGRAKCLHCDEKIEKETIRIAVGREVDIGSFMTTKPGYLHPACTRDYLAFEGLEDINLLQKLKDNSTGLNDTEIDQLKNFFSSEASDNTAGENTEYKSGSYYNKLMKSKTSEEYSELHYEYMQLGELIEDKKSINDPEIHKRIWNLCLEFNNYTYCFILLGKLPYSFFSEKDIPMLINLLNHENVAGYVSFVLESMAPLPEKYDQDVIKMLNKKKEPYCAVRVLKSAGRKSHIPVIKETFYKTKDTDYKKWIVEILQDEIAKEEIAHLKGEIYKGKTPRDIIKDNVYDLFENAYGKRPGMNTNANNFDVDPEAFVDTLINCFGLDSQIGEQIYDATIKKIIDILEKNWDGKTLN